ncbi:hypothetical protein ABSA28_00914 [Candidatus Hepatincolaceae symbiont of Richtersius coronifer]
MITYTNNITIDDNHRYHNEKTGTVNSVTSILPDKKENIKPNQAMLKGNLVHKTIESFFSGDSQPLKQLAELEKHKANEILKYIRDKKIKPKYTELSFIAQDTEYNNITYGGTVDLITNDLVIDYKTGNMAGYYSSQIAAYAKANNIPNALILYFEKDILKEQYFNQSIIETQYSYFKSKARVYQGYKDELDIVMESKLNNYASLDSQIKDLEEKKSFTKAEIIEELESRNISKYALQNYLVFPTQGGTTYSLKEDIKGALLLTKPEFFKQSTRKGSINIKIKSNSNNE